MARQNLPQHPQRGARVAPPFSCLFSSCVRIPLDSCLFRRFVVICIRELRVYFFFFLYTHGGVLPGEAQRLALPPLVFVLLCAKRERALGEQLAPEERVCAGGIREGSVCRSRGQSRGRPGGAVAHRSPRPARKLGEARPPIADAPRIQRHFFAGRSCARQCFLPNAAEVGRHSDEAYFFPFLFLCFIWLARPYYGDCRFCRRGGLS